MAAYVVLATQLHQLVGDKGDVKKWRRGDVVTNLSDGDVERHLRSGSIAAKASDEAKAAAASPAPPEPVAEEYEPPADQASPIVAELQSGGEPVARPRNAATKAAWVDFAVARGMDPDEANALTRDELRDKTK